MKKVTVIGGGTGTYVVLTGLKEYELDLGVIVTMMDSGGSTGRLRDQLGVLPPGDLRQCLVALSEAPMLWRNLFLYRFSNGDFKGHNFGNVFISALEKVCKDYHEVIKTASFVLKTKGEVIPVTFGKTHLCVEYKDGRILKGEGNIDENFEEKSGIKRAFLEEKVGANTQAIKRIINSDYIIIGPGDLYTSIIPVFLVDGVVGALKQSKAKIIYIMNLMTKSGQTTNYKASNHLQDLITYLKKEPDYVLLNSGNIAENISQWYLSHNEKIVLNDLDDFNAKIKVKIGDLINNEPVELLKEDKLTRSILRHDSQKLAKIIYHLIKTDGKTHNLV